MRGKKKRYMINVGTSTVSQDFPCVDEDLFEMFAVLKILRFRVLIQAIAYFLKKNARVKREHGLYLCPCPAIVKISIHPRNPPGSKTCALFTSCWFILCRNFFSIMNASFTLLV